MIVLLTTGALQIIQSIVSSKKVRKLQDSLVKHRFDLHDKIRPFTLKSLSEDLEEVHRYMRAVAKGDYSMPGLFAESAFDEDGNLRHVELQNLAEILGSKM